jgi:DNA-binding NtrC family response regulator
LSKILVVDDDPAHRFLLRRIFERAGHVVSDADDGAAALRAMAESRPDRVVTKPFLARPLVEVVDDLLSGTSRDGDGQR